MLARQVLDGVIAGEGTPTEVADARGLELVQDDGALEAAVTKVIEANPDVDAEVVEANLGRLEQLKNAQIGIIQLSDDLDVETVSEIFIRINSKGVPLSSADFAMSKIATYGDRGRNLRKLIRRELAIALEERRED